MEIEINNIKIKNNDITGIYNVDNDIFINLLNHYCKDNNLKIKYINEDKFYTKKVRDEFYLIQKEIKDNYLNKIISSLNIVELSKDFLDRDINSLSTSEKKLLTIALSLIINPDIIVFKNVFNNLDKNNYSVVRKIIKDLKKKYNKIILLIDDNINNLYDLCSYFIIFNDSKLFISGNKKNVFKDIESFKTNNLELPDMIKFIDISKNYNIQISPLDSIKDLIKEVYRNVNEIKR